MRRPILPLERITRSNGAGAKHQVPWKSLASLSSAILLVFILFSFSKSLASFVPKVSQTKSSHSQHPFSLLVSLEFQDSIAKQEFVKAIEPVADYVRSNEPSTLSYQVLQSDQNPLQLLILERYMDKEEAYLQIHKSSDEFLEFRPQLQKMSEQGRVKISGNSFIDGPVGFMGRP